MKFPSAFIASSVLLAGALPVSTAAPIHAEEPAGIVCMAGVTTGRSAGRAITIPVHSSQVGAMTAKGFEARSCSAEEADAKEPLRVEVCELALSAPPQVQQRFEQVYRIAPVELCAILNVGVEG